MASVQYGWAHMVTWSIVDGYYINCWSVWAPIEPDSYNFFIGLTKFLNDANIQHIFPLQNHGSMWNTTLLCYTIVIGNFYSMFLINLCFIQRDNFRETVFL